MDTLIPRDDSERRSPAIAPVARPSGLPIFATEPLTAAERDALRRAARVARLIAGQLEEAIEANTVAQALWAASHGAEASGVLDELAATLGSNR